MRPRSHPHRLRNFLRLKWMRLPALFWASIVLSLGLASGSVASEIRIVLSGDFEYPGLLILSAGPSTIEHLCFLGTGAKGQVDRDFLRRLSRRGIPEGTYRVAPPLVEEKWPTAAFTKSGALRLKAVDPALLAPLGKKSLLGVVIHGRDFYPLVMPRVRNEKMVGFYNDRLFDRMKHFWGPLRLSNWDMDRLYDFWTVHTLSAGQWTAHVLRADPQAIRKKCKPPETKRTPGG